VYCHRSLFHQHLSIVNGVSLCYLPAIERKIFSQFSHSLLATIHALFCKYDVLLYVNSANGPFGLLPKLVGQKTAINVDGVEWLRPKWKGLGSRYFKFASYLSTKLFDRVITDSIEMARIYEEVFHAQSVTIAYGAKAAWSKKPELIQEFGLQPDQYYLVVGRLIPDNNADLIVKGFLNSASKRKLVIVGDVPYRDAYATQIRNIADERVVFTGYIRDPEMLQELYCNSFVYIHGHEFGGTNPSLLTALSSGCCVAALDTRFSREVLADHEHGVYFKKDPADVAAVLSDLERDPEAVNSFRLRARDRILSRYTWEKIADEYEQLFLSLGTSFLIPSRK
jgi:glycosyltransferase involved in cell wall biosynthesis